MLPNDNKPECNAAVNMPEGTALPATANVVSQMADELNKVPGVRALQSYPGTTSPFNLNGLVRHTYLREQSWAGDIQVQLTHKGDRDQSSHELAVLAREVLRPLSDKSNARIEVVEMPPGPPVLQTMVAEIYGPNDETHRQVAADVEKLFRKSDTVVDADSYLQMPIALRGEFRRLGQLPIPSANGNLVSLTSIGHFEKYQKDDPVYHRDLRSVEYVTGKLPNVWPRQLMIKPLGSGFNPSGVST